MPYHTYTEIKTQTDAWKNALSVTNEQATSIKNLTDRYNQVIFSGCGSTYYLSLAAAALFQSLTGKTARAVPGGELLLNSPAFLADKTPTLLVAISRSGTTTETVRAVEKFKKEQRGEVIVVSNYSADLSELADLNIVIPGGQEQSVAQTRSFASMYVAVNAMCAIAAGRKDLLNALPLLPEVGQRLLSEYESTARKLGEDLTIDRVYFLGSGLNYGLACECNLKMKEMTLTHSEPFHFLEFRHGPMSMITKNALVVGLLSGKNDFYERAVLTEMQEKGARTFALSETAGEVIFNSGLPEEVRSVLYLPVLQLVAFYRSAAKGLNPDSPANLTAVVTLNI